MHLPENITFTVYKLKNGTTGWWGRLKAMLEVWQNRGAVNHVTGDITFVALALPSKGLVVTYHDLESLAQYKGWRQWVLKYLWVVLPVRRAQVVTAISQHTKEQLIKWTGCKPDKIVVIPNPLPDVLPYDFKSFNTEVPTILVMGTKANKNVEGVLEAVAILEAETRRQVTDDGTRREEREKSESQSSESEEVHRAQVTRHYKLIVVGEMTPEQQALAERYQLEIENLVQVPYEAILDAYRRCDLLCFPSFYEGFGLPIIEAQSIGRPVITSNYGAMKEVAGDGALLVNPHKIDDVRNAILDIATNGKLREQLVTEGLNNVERYQPKVVVNKYVVVYEDLGIRTQQSCFR